MRIVPAVSMLHEPGPAVPRVPERLVHDLWSARRYDPRRLATTTGQPVAVLDVGRLNTDVGPDFVGARIRLGETEWAGGVEIHVGSGSWYEHRHHEDARYNSVVLHVTLEADVWTGHLRRADGSLLPEVVLEPLLDAPLRALLHAFLTRPARELPCAARWNDVPERIRSEWIRTLAEERLAARLGPAGRPTHPADVEEVLHVRLFSALGYAKNADAMALLARHLPLMLLRTLRHAADVEALHFGVAGLLPAPADLLEADRATADYAMELRDRFERLQHLLDLPTMERSAWRFFRLRPANFPPLRIAQAAALLNPEQDGLLFRRPIPRLAAAVRAEDPIAALHDLLRVPLHAFWQRHVRLERPSRPHDPTLGRPRANAILANAVLPVLLRHAGPGDGIDRARIAGLLSALPADSDEVTRRFAALGTEPENALESQGLQQLYRAYCREARCLHCAVGRHLLQLPAGG